MKDMPTSERKRSGQKLANTFMAAGIVVFLLFGIWAIALGSERPTVQHDLEYGQWDEIGSGSASSGGISDNAGSSEHASLATTSDGDTIVAWRDNSDSDSEIYVRRWSGASWMEMGSGSASGGGISNNSGSSWSPSLAIGPDGVPIIAWSDESAGDWEIYVRRWNGTAWEEMGSGSASGGGISDNDDDSWLPSLAIGPDGTPMIAWMDWSNGDGEIYLLRWNGAAWEEMGGSASGGGVSANGFQSWEPSLAIGPDGTPVVAWYDYSDGYPEIYVRRWNGSAWVEMGSGSASGGGISNTSGDSYNPSLAVAVDGKPVIAWEDDSAGDLEIYVRRWNGMAWEEIGSGSASGAGISDNGADSWMSSLAIGPDGTLIVAWEDNSSGSDEIYVRRWNGAAWVEMGTGSASGGGVSDNIGHSRDPSLAISPGGSPIVTWHDNWDGDWEIYARRWRSLNALHLPLIFNDFTEPIENDPKDMGSLFYDDLEMNTLMSDTFHKWTITVGSTEFLTVTVAPASSANIVLSVVDERGLVIVNQQDQAPAGEVETISELKLTEPGTYEIHIATDPTEGTDYALMAMDSGSYNFSFRGTLSPGAQRSDALIVESDHFWFFSASEGETISFQVTPNDDGDAYVELYGPDGSRLLTLDDRDSGEAEKLENYSIPAGGMYGIRVGEFDFDVMSYQIVFNKP